MCKAQRKYNAKRKKYAADFKKAFSGLQKDKKKILLAHQPIAVKEASDSVRNIKNVYVEGIQALVDDTKVTIYRVNVKVTFVVD